MMTFCKIGTASCAAAFAAVAAFTASAAAVDMSGYDKGRLAPISHKSLEGLRTLTDQRIAEIRATPNMSVPTDAAVRYVSANGNDNNDGKTEATAWRTLDKLTYGNLKPWRQTPVQYVRFRRGDVFRGSIKAVSGVTYTAYGTGSKPCIYVSPKNGADPSKWTQTDAPNVWKYYAGMADVGTIVYGREAVESGLIDRLGSLHDALDTLHRMIAAKKKSANRKS